MYKISNKINSNNAINRIKKWKYENLTVEDEKYLHFKFPNRMNFISSSFREMELIDIPITELIDIYIKKAKLDSNIRAGIATTILFKLVKEQSFSDDDIENAKLELLSDIQQITKGTIKEDNPTSYDVEKVFYLIRIKLGSQDILKYGITNDLNQRLRQYKSNIKSFDGYSSRYLEIEVLNFEPTTKAKLIEQEVKEQLRKKRVKMSGFYFEGYTETLENKNFDKFMKIIKPIVEKYR